MRFLERVYYIVMMIASAALIGFASVISGAISWELVKTWTFFWSQMATWIAIVLITIATVYMSNDNYKSKNEDFLSAEKSISEFAKSEENVPTFLHRFMDSVNKNRKSAQYKFKMQRKAYRLMEYHPIWYYMLIWNWGLPRSTDENLHIWIAGTEEEKKNNRYCRKLQYIKEQSDDKYIQENIDLIPVRYKRINDTVLLGGYYNDIDKKGPNDFIETSMTLKILKAKIPKMLLSFAVMFILSSMVPDGWIFNKHVLISIAIKLAGLAWNGYLAIHYAKNVAQPTLLHDVRFRLGIIVEYRKWLGQKLAEQQKEAKHD